MNDAAIKSLSECQYIVEANHNEAHNLWYMYTQVYRVVTDREWQQLIPGYLIEVGSLGGRPVSLSLYFVSIKGVKVCFFESPSQVVDWKLIDEWLDKHFNKLYDGRSCRCDATNFHQCMSVVNQLCST